MKKLIFLLFFGLVMGMVTSASAALVNLDPTSPETPLWIIYNNMYPSAPDLFNDTDLEALENGAATGGGLYSSSSGYAYLIAKMADYDHLVYQDSGPTIIVDDSDKDNPTYVYDRSVSLPVPPIGLFGMKIVSYNQYPTPGTIMSTWYSQHTLNVDSQQYHFAVYNTPDSDRLFVGVEDLSIPDPSDEDYNDFVFELYNVRPPEVIPEPTSMMLLGLGVLGVFGLRKKV